MSTKTILVTAYAVEPYKGSEDGMGWNMILQIARFQKVIAITRKNNRLPIEKYMEENDVPEAEHIQFVYFDLPQYLRFWKKGGRGALLYFYLWQLGVALWLRGKNWSFDLAHNLNFHNDWTPSFLWLTGKPMVWGPVGHHPLIPSNFLAPYGAKARFRNRLRWMTKQWFWRCSPMLWMTKRRAAHIFAMNTNAAENLGVDPKNITLLPSVGCEATEVVEKEFSTTSFTVLSVGRFVALKGFDLTIRAFAEFIKELPETHRQKARLILVGKGPELPRMKQWIAEAGIEAQTEIIPWVKRDQLSMIYQQADVFLFPSHEGAGMVVAEALSYGLPVLCLDNCGPGELIKSSCGRKVPYSDYQTTVTLLSEQLTECFFDLGLRKKLSNGAFRHFRTWLKWDVKGMIFKEVYDSLLKQPVAPAEILEQVKS